MKTAFQCALNPIGFWPIDRTTHLTGEFVQPSDLRGTNTGMSNPERIRRFEYRPCRIPAGINVEFVTEGERIYGLCRDVSDTGIRVSFDGSVVVGGSGILTLRHSTGVLELKAHVAYIKDNQVGLTFLFESDWERGVTVDFIASIASQTIPSSVVRFP